MKSIILIGMPGVGKSTVGVITAKKLGLQFVDTDLLIQKKEKMLLADIIEQRGIDRFLEIENKINVEAAKEECVIAPGGSVIYCKEAMEQFRKVGFVVYLKISFDTIRTRLENIKGRGVVLRDGQDLKQLYEERVPLFEAYADIVIDEEGLNVEETIENVVEAYQKARN